MYANRDKDSAVLPHTPSNNNGNLTGCVGVVEGCKHVKAAAFSTGVRHSARALASDVRPPLSSSAAG